MSRSGYSDDHDELELGRWRGQVTSAIRGKRGQKFFRDLIAALEALDEQRLVTSMLKNSEGEVCALGALCSYRGIDLEPSDDEYDFDSEWTANQLDIAVQLAEETVYENDEGASKETSEERWSRMRRWAERNLLARPEAAK